MKGCPPAAVDRAWAERFGVTIETLRRRELVVVPHADVLEAYAGAEILQRHGGATMVSVPDAWVERAHSFCRELAAESLFEPRTLLALFDHRVARWIGPSYQAYIDRSNARALVDAERRAKVLRPGERHALQALKCACSARRWSVAGVEADADLVCGRFVDGVLVAAASLRTLAPGVGDPCVVTHPDHAGCGYGTSVVAAVLREAFRREVVVLYQTLEANTAAVSLAERLGFRRYGRKLAVRLRGPSSGTSQS